MRDGRAHGHEPRQAGRRGGRRRPSATCSQATSADVEEEVDDQPRAGAPAATIDELPEREREVHQAALRARTATRPAAAARDRPRARASRASACARSRPGRSSGLGRHREIEALRRGLNEVGAGARGRIVERRRRDTHRVLRARSHEGEDLPVRERRVLRARGHPHDGRAHAREQRQGESRARVRLTFQEEVADR